MTNHPSDNHSDRHDDLHPGGEGGHPVNRRNTGNKTSEPKPQVSENRSPDQIEPQPPRELCTSAEGKGATPDVKRGEDPSSPPRQEIRAEEKLRAEENLSAKDTPSNPQEPTARTEAEHPKAEAAGEKSNNDNAGGQADSQAKKEADKEEDSPGRILRSLNGKPKHVFLPDGVKKISAPLLRLLGSAETLRLGASFEELPELFPLAVRSLRSIEVSDKNPNFRSVNGVLYSKDGKTLLLYPCRKRARSFAVPEPVKTIAKYAFCRCEWLRSLFFPDTLRTLEEKAVFECSNLLEVYLPRLIETIHHKAFFKADFLERIEVLGGPDPNQKLPPAEGAPAGERYRSVDGILYSSDQKRLVLYPGGRDDPCFKIPETVEVIGRYAFNRCLALRTILLGASVRKIELLAEPIDQCCYANATPFGECRLLKSFGVDPANPVFRSIDGVLYQNDARVLVCYPPAKKDRAFRVPDSVETIGPYALADNDFLERVIVTNSVRTIEQGAFLDCGNLRSVAFSDNLRSMGDRAFALCDSLTAIRIPKSLRGFDRCFDGCLSLERIDVDPENPDFRGYLGMLFSKDLTHLIHCPAARRGESLVVPDQVTTIESGALEDCRDLCAVKVPATVRVIEPRAFRSRNFDSDSSQTIYAEVGSAAWDFAKENHVRVADIDDFPEREFLD